MSRYLRRKKAINNEQQYDKIFEKRGVKKITQFRSPFDIFIDQEVLDSIDCHRVVWTSGESYERLAQRFYGNFKQWWVIAAFNRKPTESHAKHGDVIRIPKDLSIALQVVSQ